jgi:hypothetical protein
MGTNFRPAILKSFSRKLGMGNCFLYSVFVLETSVGGMLFLRCASSLLQLKKFKLYTLYA